jgi:hypothetical protein
MPHRALAKVARELTQAFTSLINPLGEEFVLGYIIAAAWSTAAKRIRLDLLTGNADPSPLLVPKVGACLARYSRHFRWLLDQAGVHLSAVSSAEMLVTVDPTTLRPYGNSGLAESPYTCATRIVDTEGRVHEYGITGWWYPEPCAVGRRSWRVRLRCKKV